MTSCIRCHGYQSPVIPFLHFPPFLPDILAARGKGKAQEVGEKEMIKEGCQKKKGKRDGKRPMKNNEPIIRERQGLNVKGGVVGDYG